MPEKRATYRINESMLRNVLLGYSVEVDASKCNAIEQEASTIRMQKAIVLPSAKVLIKFVAIPLLLLTIGILVYSNIDSIQSAFTPLPEPVKINAVKKVSIPPPVIVKTQTTAAIINTPPPPVVNNVVVKHETNVAVTKTTDSVKQQTTKQAVPVIAGPPSDSIGSKDSKTDSVETKTNKVDTASQKTEPPVKKKKKRRHRSNNMDDLKESTLQPNSADDDVVVPQ